MPLILPGNVASAIGGAYDVANSCRFNDGDSSYMHKTIGSAGSGTKWTFSAWVKLGVINDVTQTLFSYAAATSGDVSRGYIYIADNRKLSVSVNQTGSSWTHSGFSNNNQLFRDPSAWMHICIGCDTTQGTEANRLKGYINGVQTTFNTYPAEDLDTGFNSAVVHAVGRTQNGADSYYDGYMAEVVWIDGTQYAASDFGEFDSDSPTIWKPKDVSGLTFGTNGFYLDFEASGNLGNDANGGTDLTEVNLAAADQSTDTPTNNFATLNPLIEWYPGYTSTFSEGNLDVTRSDNGAGHSTIMVSSGKWYAEFKAITVGSGGNEIGAVSYELTLNAWLASNKGVAYTSAGNKVIDGTSSSYGDSYAANDIISIALNLDDGECVFYKNGTAQNSGTAISGFSTASVFAIMGGGFGSTWKWSANFGTPSPSITISSGNADANGYGNFEYSVPTNYYALCTKNLAEFGG